MKCRQFTFINFGIYFCESFDMMQKNVVFRQLSRYICKRRIQWTKLNWSQNSFGEGTTQQWLTP